MVAVQLNNILAKVVANRLEKVIINLVHPDQVRFIRNHFGADIS